MSFLTCIMHGGAVHIIVSRTKASVWQCWHTGLFNWDDNVDCFVMGVFCRNNRC
jgi:hypothetical protein